MKTILFLMPRFGMGGISKMACYVANLYNEYGCTCICCSLIPDEITVKLDENIETLCLNYNINDVAKKNFIEKFLSQICLLLKIRKVIKKYKINTICAFGTDLIRIAIFAKKLLNCKMIGSERGNPFAYSKKQYHKYYKAMKKCDIVVFQTNNARSAFNLNREKTEVIANPAIPRGEAIPSFTGEERRKRIVSCGRLSAEKNFRMLIDAYEKMNNKQYRLIIYGNGPDDKLLKHYIKEKKLDSKIEIINNCNDVFKYEYSSAMFILSSNTEGMPNALIEAMSLGIPCIATDCPAGGVRELLDAGRRGILIPINDTDKLREAMDFFADNPEIAAKYGKVAMEVNEEYSSVHISSQWLEVLRRVDKGIKKIDS